MNFSTSLHGKYSYSCQVLVTFCSLLLLKQRNDLQKVSCRTQVASAVDPMNSKTNHSFVCVMGLELGKKLC